MNNGHATRKQKSHLIDLGEIMYFLDGILLVEHGMSNDEKAGICRDTECSIQILRLGVWLESGVSGINLANSLLQTLLKSTSNSHHLTHRLHRRADLTIYLARELG